jgi:hypothetical protein
MPTSSDDLTATDLAMLAFEREWWRYAGDKSQAIAQQFDGMSSSRYYELLNSLIDRDAAFDYDSMLIKRLRRLRDQRVRARAARAAASS